MLPRLYNIAVKKWKTVKRYVERALIGSLVVDKKSHLITEPHNVHYKNLQKCYIMALYLASFADWLQGPYIYKLYKDYGYEEDAIAILYITGFASSCIFGTVLGQLADRYGRKTLCTAFTILYSLCCLTKTSPNYGLLLLGRILGGISTSILFTAFEAWYVNEHLNFYKLPPEWLNSTFAKATALNGLSAIVAGLVAQFFAEHLLFGSVSPFLLAIPFLLMSLLVIQSTWKEHVAIPKPQEYLWKDFLAPLGLLFDQDKTILCLGIVQSVYESAMYTFIFSWTPILADLDPPLGLVFALFMISLMFGSKTYAWFVNHRYQPQNLLVAVCIVATANFIIVSLSLTTIVVHVQDHNPVTNKSMSILCFVAFLIYEFSVGMYYPAVGYLRSRIIPEDYRASISNWLRVPMNIITCFSLTMKYGGDTRDVSGLQKFQFVFCFCSLLLLGTIPVSLVFARKFSKKIIHEELEEIRAGKNVIATETI